MREIATSPGMIAEARQVLPALKVRAMSPAGAEGVTRIIAGRFQTYPQPIRNDTEWQAWWADYMDALEDIPEGALEAAMTAWVRAGTSQFLPKPGELRQLALTTENRDARSYERARKACEYEPPKVYDNHHAPKVQPRIMRAEPTDAQRDWARSQAAAFAAQVPRPKLADFPASHGATDERGLTQAMREHLTRQREATR